MTDSPLLPANENPEGVLVCLRSARLKDSAAAIAGYFNFSMVSDSEQWITNPQRKSMINQLFRLHDDHFNDDNLKGWSRNPPQGVRRMSLQAKSLFQILKDKKYMSLNPSDNNIESVPVNVKPYLNYTNCMVRIANLETDRARFMRDSEVTTDLSKKTFKT